MERPRLDINIKSENYSFTIEEKQVSKIYIVFPLFFSNVSTKLVKTDEKLSLELYDQIASSCVGPKNYMQRLYSLNPVTKTIRIIVPSSNVIDLNINLENGTIFLDKLHVERATICSLKGNIGVQNSNVGNMIIDGYQSKILIKSLEGYYCEAKTKTGNIKLEGTLPEMTELETILGDIFVDLNEDVLNTTMMDICSKRVNYLLRPTYEMQKIIQCRAPYGCISTNI